MRDQEAAPSEVVVFNESGSNKGADDYAGGEHAERSQFVTSGGTVPRAEVLPEREADGKEETEFQEIVDGQGDEVGREDLPRPRPAGRF